MKLLCKLTALAVCVALLLSLVSCADFGVGENEDDFKKYFSGVYVLSKSGLPYDRNNSRRFSAYAA